MKDKIWVCEECDKIFSEEEMQRHKQQEAWGHPCKAHPRSKREWRCEAYLRKFINKI